MARAQIGNNMGVTAKGGSGTNNPTNFNGGTAPGAGLDLDNTDTVDAMRARLTAIDAATYSATELDKMTFNDMVYAIRVNDSLGSI